jgi:hypothetical protein
VTALVYTLRDVLTRRLETIQHRLNVKTVSIGD